MAEFIRRTQGPPIIKAMSSNTLSDNYRDAITISYQYIDGVIPKTDFEFCGKTFDTPVMAGPVGLFGKGPASGVVGYARSVRAAGSVYWATFHDPEEWKTILSEGIPALRVIKPLADMDRVLEEIQYDTDHGAIGYAMDIDHGLTSYGELDAQKESFAPKSMKELKILSEASSLPFYLKNVLSVRDAIIAFEVSAEGIVISGHNNRFPCAVPPLKILPEIRWVVGDRLKIFVDGGINNGYDAFKALALGADGVLSARALCSAFVQNGEEGLTYKLQEMTAELKGAMANTGSVDLTRINRECIILP